MTTRTLRAEHRTQPFRELGLSLAASGGITAAILAVGILIDRCLCSSALVCWGLVCAGILGTHLASRDVAWGWLLLVSLQPLWIVYALTTEQYGFIVGSLAYGLGQWNGFLRTRRNRGNDVARGGRSPAR